MKSTRLAGAPVLAKAALAAFAAAIGLQVQDVAANIPATASYSCDFENTYCDFQEQSKIASIGGHRSSIVGNAASGARGVKLTTLVGDSGVNGSGTWERNDLSKSPDASYCNPGQEEWWAFSVMFPDDYVFPPGPEAGIIMDFHHNASSGQANYEVQTIPGIGLRARGYGGAAVNQGKYDALIPDPYGATANITKNAWYHFVLHVRWSPNGDGLMEAWLNGRKFQSYQGATLYSGISCYLKLANYHGAFGQASSLIHDRVVRGATAASVTLMALEGVAGTAPPPPAPTAYALSTVTMGSGTGTVTSSPSGINCGSSCSTTFGSGAVVTLNASPASGSTFSGWSGACGGTGGCTVTMSAARNVTATFAAASSSPPSALVTHFYGSVLRREPDAGGKAYWEGEIARMASLGVNPNESISAMAATFFSSAEYTALRRDNAGFVADLYTTFFNRAADAGGLAFWTGQIGAGMPRDIVLLGFMFSPEFGAFTRGFLGNPSTRAEVDMVTDLYRGLLGRLPDNAGFPYWVQRFRTAQCQGAAAVYGQVQAMSSAFLNSAEYAGRARDNAQYVSDSYNAFLRRGGDLAGVGYWVGQLQSGAKGRETLRQEFVASAEFTARVGAVVAQGCL